MANRVKFQNGKGKFLYAEVGELNNLVEGTPVCFDNAYDGYARLALLDVYCMLFPNLEIDEKPVFYFRHTDVLGNKYRFGNVVELGDDYLGPQKGVRHAGKVADADTIISTPYGKISEEPLVYGIGSEEKLVEYRYYKDRLTAKEGDFLNLTAIPWKYTIYDHQSIYQNSSVIFQPATFIGELDGQPVIGLGSYDRFCTSRSVKSFGNIPMGYIALCAMGIREDGRKEMLFLNVPLIEEANSYVCYILDGEAPIFTDKVELEIEWERLPYIDDDTCTFKNATAYFCGKEIHFNGKWGSKGFLEKPRLEKHGQSQVFGTWYEGKTPYTHRLYYAFSESMEAFADNLKNLGFTVRD